MASKRAQHLAFAARKAATRREYLGYYLAQYQGQEQMTEEAMMSLVGCSGEAYYRLALCQVPDVRASDFAQRLDRVAGYAGASTVKIAQVIRQVDAIEALRTTMQPEQPGEAVSDPGRASTGSAALDLMRETRQMMGASDADRKTASPRSPIGSALLAARDRDEQDAKDKGANDAKPEDKANE